MRVTFLLLSLALTLGPPTPTLAQGPLDDVETLMGQGRIIQAREVLQGWLQEEGDSADRSQRQRGIWLRALLTVDPSMASLDFRRLVLEFPGGPYSDEALLRLAQIAESENDVRGAFGHYAALERDYPLSPHRNLAGNWVRDHRAEVEALPPPRNTRTEAVPAPIIGPEARGASAEGEGAFSVQLGAFRNIQGARALLSQLVDSGHDARLVRVRGKDLLRVRAGRFATREEASNLRQTFVRAGFDATVVTDADLEEEVG